MEERRIITDTDFLSAFLKIDKLPVIFTVFDVKSVIITNAVLDELKCVSLFDSLEEYINSRVNTVLVKKAREVPSFKKFGKGELESIEFAKNKNFLLLMDDRDAAKYAESQGVAVMDIPTFLFYSKIHNKLSKEEVEKIVSDLELVDNYIFDIGDKKILLS